MKKSAAGNIPRSVYILLVAVVVTNVIVTYIMLRYFI